MPDIKLSCKDCGNPFVWTEGEQDFYKQKGFQQPLRCTDCRRAKKEQRNK